MNDDPIVFDGALEIRARDRGGRVLSGRFPLNKTATVRSGGRVRKERFAPDSMSWQVREFQKLQAELADVANQKIAQVQKQILIEQLEDAIEKRNTFLLVGHSYDRTIADMRSGTLAVVHKPDAVELEAELPDDDAMPSWVRDAVLAVKGGQLRGISPGFQVAKGREHLEREDPAAGDAIIRVIDDAVVYEFSLVSRPAYAGTDVDARADDPIEPNRRRRVWL